MKWFLYAISLFWIAAGSCFILYTSQCRASLKKILGAVSEKFLAILALVIGILLIMAASESRNVWIIVFLGVLAICKGILFLFNPKNSFEKIRDWYLHTASDQTYRFFGIVSLIVGMAVFLWI